MKIKALLFASLFILTSFASQAQKKVLGYFPYYRSAADIAQIDFDNLTDVVFAFMLGNTATGGIKYPNNDNTLFKAVADAADAKGVGVWISVGGGGWVTNDMVAAVKLNRAKFVEEVVDFCAGANSANLVLKGVDVDWEFPKTTSDKDLHELLICDLRTAFDAQTLIDGHHYSVSIAVGGDVKSPTNHLGYINSATFACADEVVIMSYDGPGTFYNGHHSSLQMAKDNVVAWENAGCPKNKMILALPFYGSNSSQTSSETYEGLTGYFPGIDLFAKDEHLGWYYNGEQTLKDKVDYICSEGGLGVTIWELTQDVDKGSAKTLLEIVYNQMATSNCPGPTATSELENQNGLVVFPNPFTATIQLDTDEAIVDAIQVYDLSGKLLLQETNFATSKPLNLEKLSSGTYLLQLSNAGKTTTSRIIKK